MDMNDNFSGQHISTVLTVKENHYLKKKKKSIFHEICICKWMQFENLIFPCSFSYPDNKSLVWPAL